MVETRQTAPPEQALDGVRTAGRLFAAAAQAPRWPMYMRQVRQYLRAVDETFDERKFGFSGVVEFLRACQKEGLLRLDRDRQGVLRVFAGANFSRPAATAATVEAAPEAIEEVVETVEPIVVDEVVAGGAEPDVPAGDVVVEETAMVVDGEVAPAGQAGAPPPKGRGASGPGREEVRDEDRSAAQEREEA